MITGEVIIRSFFSSDLINVKLNNKLVQVELTEIASELGDLLGKFPFFLACVSLFGQKAWNFYPNKSIKELRKRTDGLLNLCEKCVIGRLEAKRDHYLKNIPED